jgi:transcriptional regulatory protein RtcR
MRTVVFGIIGTVLDGGFNKKRHERWRPTVSIALQSALPVARMELLHDATRPDLALRVAEDIRAARPEIEVVLHSLTWRDPWDLEEVFGLLHDFARGYRFDTAREQYLVHMTTGTHVAQICLFLLTEARYFPARLLQTSPPEADAPDPAVGRQTVIDLDLARYDRVAARFERERRDARVLLKSGIETRNARFNRMIERIEQVAVASKAPMLVLGPTGAGKSWLAKRVFQLKRDRHQLRGEFVEVNCATLRGDAAMSALFGHARGAFTGAAEARAGLLRKADGGLLFLDEIGELGADEQAMLLRAIEEKTFFPMGGDKEVKSDFQLIAGTNRDLRLDARRGRFREDLLARIDLWTFRLPGLAERPEDIEPNLEFELERLSGQMRAKVSINDQARARFLRFATSAEAPWRGNFRDFNAALTRMATLAEGGRITATEVDEEIGRLREAWREDPDAPSRGPANDPCLRVLGAERLADIDRFDRVQLAEVLRVCRSARSLSDAGRALFDRSRERRASVNDADRLRKYLARFDLTFEQVRERLDESEPRSDRDE